MSHFAATQADTSYFPLFTFFIVSPSLQKYDDEKIFFPSHESKPCCPPCKMHGLAIPLNNRSYNSHRIALNFHSGCTQFNNISLATNKHG
jgi:hypothetical protein